MSQAPRTDRRFQAGKMRDKYTDRDRRGIEFANMQADMYGIVGVLLLVGFLAYGVALLIWGPEQVATFLGQVGAK